MSLAYYAFVIALSLAIAVTFSWLQGRRRRELLRKGPDDNEESLSRVDG
jgi:hypothetical protein